MGARGSTVIAVFFLQGCDTFSLPLILTCVDTNDMALCNCPNSLSIMLNLCCLLLNKSSIACSSTEGTLPNRLNSIKPRSGFKSQGI